MPDIMMRLGSDMLVFDGAMGTMLQRSGIEPGTSPDLLNIVEPDMIMGIHTSYHMVGADCVTTNSFGASRPKLAEYGLEDQLAEINAAAVRLARAGGSPHIMADIGPTGLIAEPMGTASFDQLFDIFAEQAAALATENPDAFLLETFTDITELRIAVLACKSVSELPVCACASFGINGRMDISGTDPATAAVILEAAGADAVGMNCGLGPEQMLPLLKQMIAATTLPVIAQPNAGLPHLDPVSGKTVFPGTPDELADFARDARLAGAAAVGSCCGSSPSFTGAIAAEVSGLRCAEVGGRGFSGLVAAGPRGLVEIGTGSFASIGERINPTGRPELKESLLQGSTSVVRKLGAEQSQAGASLIDINVGAAGVDAVTMLPKAVVDLSGIVDQPLVLDTTDPRALAAALRIYPGKALVNSVNGETASLEAVLPLVKQFGASVVALTLDDNGIPKDSQTRFAIAERIITLATALGIPRKDIIVDALVMTAAADKEAPAVTLDTVRMLHEASVPTMLGVSNVSHGLPMRGALNAAFLAAAKEAGLDAAIINPNDHEMRMAATSDPLPQSRVAFDVLLEKAYELGRGGATQDSSVIDFTAETARDPEVELRKAISRGDAEGAPRLVDALIQSGLSPATIIEDVLTPAINYIGEGFGRGEVFLPQLMAAADAMKTAVAQAKTYLDTTSNQQPKGRIAFATVKGDIHSIGKDICISLLESHGYEVENLGVDVPIERVLEAAQTADAICLSALMTTTLPAMTETVKSLHAANNLTPVFVGGAVVTPEFASSIGAAYSTDAPDCVAKVGQSLGKESSQ